MAQQKGRPVTSPNSSEPFRRQLGIELARLRSTEQKMASTFLRQIEIAKQIATLKTLKQALPLWRQYIALVHVIRHDLSRSVSTWSRVEEALAY